MNSYSVVARMWSAYLKRPTLMRRVAFPGAAGVIWNLPIAIPAVPAYEAFADLMAEHDYPFRESAGGTYNPRAIAGTDPPKYSLHAYGIALDLNPSKNPPGGEQHNYPQGFIDDVETITASGQQVFRWGIIFNDPMHWEINVSPALLGKGLDMADGPNGEPNWDEVSDFAKNSWTAAYKAGLLTDDSHPQDIVEVEQMMVFLNRANVI